MNTGVQRSSATPYKARTTTTPPPYHKLEFKKDFMEIIAAHNVPYAATAIIGFPEDFIRKVKKAQGIKGFRFLHLLTPCPTGWNFETNLTVEIARLAVETKIFNLYEVENGVKYTINYFPEQEVPVREYLKHQKRFRFLDENDIQEVQEDVHLRWRKLLKKAQWSDEIAKKESP
jgi:pyruvate/2-oxoacid:ferredoxin oxidoreductase beta subunit